MSSKMRKSSILIFLIVLILSGCAPKSHYERVVQRELSKGIRHDNLFLGFKLGMTKKDFYAHAWKLNKEHMVTNSSSNMTVVYQLDSLKSPAKMSFYPRFYKNKIYLMPVQFIYDAWAPWNKQYSADSLETDILHLMQKWYGKGFFIVKGPHGEIAHVQVDGNRRITVLKHNDRVVDVLFTDLIAERQKDQVNDGSLWDKIKSWF